MLTAGSNAYHLLNLGCRMLVVDSVVGRERFSAASRVVGENTCYTRRYDVAVREALPITASTTRSMKDNAEDVTLVDSVISITEV